MKKRILKILLSLVMVSLNAPILSTTCEKTVCNSYVDIQKEEIIDVNRVDDKNININEEIEIAIEKMNQTLEEINKIKNLKDWFVSYKTLVENYSYILDSPETIYDYYTNEELSLLFRVVQAEVGDEYTFDQKVNVASVIFNRIEHEDFPDEILDILSKDQFQPISDGRYQKVEVSEITILACEYSFMFGDTTGGCLFFDSNGKLNYEFVEYDGAHNLYK